MAVRDLSSSFETSGLQPVAVLPVEAQRMVANHPRASYISTWPDADLEHGQQPVCSYSRLLGLLATQIETDMAANRWPEVYVRGTCIDLWNNPLSPRYTLAGTFEHGVEYRKTNVVFATLHRLGTVALQHIIGPKVFPHAMDRTAKAQQAGFNAVPAFLVLDARKVRLEGGNLRHTKPIVEDPTALLHIYLTDHLLAVRTDF